MINIIDKVEDHIEKYNDLETMKKNLDDVATFCTDHDINFNIADLYRLINNVEIGIMRDVMRKLSLGQRGE